MKVGIVFPGKLKDGFARDGFEHFRKMLTGRIKLDLHPVKDETCANKADAPRALAKEGERLLAAMGDYGHAIVLDERGKTLDSPGLARHIEALKTSGVSSLCFVIGSAFGLDSAVRKRANLLLSLSNFTLPHQLALLVVAEQVFRAVKIASGETYHY